SGSFSGSGSGGSGTSTGIGYEVPSKGTLIRLPPPRCRVLPIIAPLKVKSPEISISVFGAYTTIWWVAEPPAITIPVGIVSEPRKNRPGTWPFERNLVPLAISSCCLEPGCQWGCGRYQARYWLVVGSP